MLKIKPETWIILKIGLLTLCLFLFFYLLIPEKKSYALALIPVVVWLVYDLWRMMKKAQEELRDFAESIKYRDFSRNFNVSQAPSEVKTLREGFNDINTTLRVISRERETQFLYIQQILELVDIGILSFELESGRQNWMNQAFKKMFGIPYLKTIQSLKLRDEKLYDEVLSIRPGQSKVITAHAENRSLRILISSSLFQTEGVANKLVAFQNVNLALNENESQAWQRLLSVMTHEIMNSVAPISSLAGSLKSRLPETSGSESILRADLEDLNLGLETIERRSEGLLKFAQTYRNLNKILTPSLQSVFVRDIFENLITLMQPSLDQKEISLEVVLKEPKLVANIDVSLIEQVLINLITNAAEALKERTVKRIVLSAGEENQRLLIRVADTGTGIEADLLDKIFVPFFSTKKNR
jgi:two-component system nitrogen regulation sensor histidine kinase NtrY